MTTITQSDIGDITGMDDNMSWTFYSPAIRESGDGDGIVTPKKVRRYPLAGVLTVELDPGPAVVHAPDGKPYPFTVPEEDSELWPLIQASVTIPPSTTHQQLLDAVDAWLEVNTLLWASITGKPAVIAAGATQAAARTAINAVGKGEIVFNARDYAAVGDGTTDDATALQNVINAAAAASALAPVVVLVPNGTYVCSGLTGASSVTFRGMGLTKSVIKVKSDTAATKLLNLSGLTDVSMEGLGFDGNNNTTCLSGPYVSTNGGSKNLTVRNCKFSNFMPVAQLSSVHAALYVWTAKDVVVENCVFVDNGRACSMESPDGSVRVSGCIVTASSGRMATGIRAYQSSGVATSAKVRFTDNYVDSAEYDPVGDGSDGHGIAVYRVQDVNITGNVCTGSGRGIIVSYLGHGAIISHNQCNYNDDAGIRIEPEITSGSTTVGTAGANRACNINDNTCHDNAGIGITASYAAGSKIIGNTCHDNGEWGIHVDSDRTVVIGNTAFNNYKTGAAPGPGEGNKAGIVNYAGVGCIFIGNVCFDNQTVKTQTYGLSITNNLSPVVMGNDFTGNGTADIDNPTQAVSYQKPQLVAEYSGVTSVSGVAVPVGATRALVTLIAPGAGGGSGRRGAAGTIRGGGASGGGGGMTVDFPVKASLFGSTFSVGIPAGGAGGAAVTANDTNGNAGGSPGPTTFVSGSTQITAWTGTGGGAGTATGATGGNGEEGFHHRSAGGANSSATGGAGSTGTGGYSTTSGGSGGGITSADVAGAGGAGGISWAFSNGSAGSGGVVGGASPGAGEAAKAGLPGSGAGGGAASITTAAQAGANATAYGSGGAGGGASLNGNNSGAGGNGGPGYVRIVWQF